MTPEELRELVDLTRLAKERSRKALLSVLQLIEKDHLCSAVATVVAVDIITGAGVMMERATGRDEDAAQRVILLGILDKLGVDPRELVIADAMRRKVRGQA